MLAPIILFVYNRPWHTQQTVEALQRNDLAAESELFVFCDGPKETATEEQKAKIKEVRDYVHNIKGFKNIHIEESEQNKGLANSLIAGITKVVNQYGKVIIVEDDIVTSTFFLKYMNDALEKYEHEDKVSAVSAFVNPVKVKLPETFFLKYFACWGWGTWKRGWNLFNPDSDDLIRKFSERKQIKLFNIDYSQQLYEMLKMQAAGKIDSWAIRFHASSFLAGKLILFPKASMTIQIGMDGTGVHCGKNSLYDNMKLNMKPIDVEHCIPVKMSKKAFRAYRQFYFESQEIGWKSQLYLRFKFISDLVLIRNLLFHSIGYNKS